MSNTKVIPILSIRNSPTARGPLANGEMPGWNDGATIPAGRFSSGKSAAGLPSPRLNRVLVFVEENLAVDLNLFTLAGVAGMSPYYFCRSFKQSTGITPHRYVLQRRMELAKRLLEQRSGYLAEIAQQVGFADQSQFARVFRKIVGMTPSEYRKNRVPARDLVIG